MTRAPHAPLSTHEDVVLVVRRLRQHGSAAAWRRAREIEQESRDGVKLEWCHDSAWRFFPIESDELLGWRLHWIEMADAAEAELNRAGTSGMEVGLAFMQPNGSIGWFDDPGVVPHRATLGGAAPRLVD